MNSPQDFDDYDDQDKLEQKHSDVNHPVPPGASLRGDQLHPSVLQNHFSEGGCQGHSGCCLHPSGGRIFSYLSSIRNNMPIVKMNNPAPSGPYHLHSGLSPRAAAIRTIKANLLLCPLSIVNLDSTVSAICSLSFCSNCRRAQEEISLAYLDLLVKATYCVGLLGCRTLSNPCGQPSRWSPC